MRVTECVGTRALSLKPWASVERLEPPRYCYCPVVEARDELTRRVWRRLGRDDVFGAGAFGALADGERHAIAFAQ